MVNFEYCLLDTIPVKKYRCCKGNRIVIMYLIKNLPELFKNRIETRIIKKHLKKMKEYVGIYIKTEKSTGTRWLWQQN